MQRLRLHIAHLQTENARLRAVETAARELTEAIDLEQKAPSLVETKRGHLANEIGALDTLRNQHALRSYLGLLVVVRELVHALPPCRACGEPATRYQGPEQGCDEHTGKDWVPYRHTEALRRTLALLDNLLGGFPPAILHRLLLVARRHARAGAARARAGGL